MINYLDMSYLGRGNEIQRFTYSILCQYTILETLKIYTPIIVGTIPIQIDIPSSDIDIICEVSDFKEFHSVVTSNFSQFDNFKHDINENNYVACFLIDNKPIEIYAEKKSTLKQAAYLHMLIEDRILKILGENFRKKIIELKRQGYKTEPAFGYLLRLSEPYSELLDLADKSDKELLQRFSFCII